MSKLTMDNVAAMSVQYSRYSFAYFVDSMEKCGIRNIELWSGEPHYWRANYISSGSAERQIREYRKMMEDKGMRVVMYTPETLVYPFEPAAGNFLTRSRTVDMFKWAIEDALAFGTSQLFCNSGTGLYDEPREAAWERAVETFQEAAFFAEKMGVSLNLEQLQPYESNLVCTAADVLRMLNDIGADNVYCCLDVAAMAVAEESIDEFYKIVGTDRIRHIHFSDRNHEVPGTRDLPLKEYISFLEKKDYQGCLSLEVNDSIYLEKPHEAFMESAENMRRLLQST